MEESHSHAYPDMIFGIMLPCLKCTNPLKLVLYFLCEKHQYENNMRRIVKSLTLLGIPHFKGNLRSLLFDWRIMGKGPWQSHICVAIDKNLILKLRILTLHVVLASNLRIRHDLVKHHWLDPRPSFNSNIICITGWNETTSWLHRCLGGGEAGGP